MAGETASTQAIQDWLLDRLLNFPAPGGTSKVADILATRCYWDRPPANAAYPFGLVRLIGMRNTGTYNRERMQGALELTMITRPADATQVTALNLAGDLAQGAMMFARSGDSAAATAGLIFVGEGTRDPLPAPQEPVDEQTYTVRIVFVVTVWPRYLSRYAHP
jgi:hypothetical protein